MLSLAEQQIFERSKRPLFQVGETSGAIKEHAINVSCGDEIALYLSVNADHLLQVTHSSRGCAVSTASADILCELLSGQLLDGELLTAEQLIEAIAVPLSPARLKCALLPLEALRKGLNSLRMGSAGQD